MKRYKPHVLVVDATQTPPFQLQQESDQKPALHRCGPDSADSAEEDFQIIQRIGEGDDSAFDVLYRRWSPRIRIFVARKLRDDPDPIENATTDTMLVIRRHAAEGRLPPSITAVDGWIYARARIAARRHSAGFRDICFDQMEHFAGCTEDEWDVGAGDTEFDRRRLLLLRQLRHLSPGTREAIQLRLEGFSFGEIASAQGVELDKVYSRIEHGVVLMVEAIFARKRTGCSGGRVLFLSRVDRAHITNVAAQIRARAPSISRLDMIKEVCRQTGIFIGPQSRLIQLLGYIPKKGSK
jgi:DNA-directed RNA polymerase specialized sigma24 family protein